MPLLIILALLLGGGGLTVAANNAMPTELLYPLKVYVTETVVGLLQFSDDAKTEFQIERAAKRLEEAEQLANQGTFTSDAKAVVETNFVNDISDVEQKIDALQAENNLPVAAEVSTHFESTLDAHKLVLLQLASVGDQQETDIRSLVSTVVDHANTIASKRGTIVTAIMSSGDQDLKITADQALKSEQTIHDQATQFINDHQDVLGPDGIAQAQTRINGTQDLLSKAQSFYDAGNYGAAYIYFQQAYNVADETKKLVDVRTTLHIPVDLTAETDLTVSAPAIEPVSGTQDTSSPAPSSDQPSSQSATTSTDTTSQPSQPPEPAADVPPPPPLPPPPLSAPDITTSPSSDTSSTPPATDTSSTTAAPSDTTQQTPTSDTTAPASSDTTTTTTTTTTP